ncbi:hypothetical protein PR048_030620 [Dryococelus australis]|uniref:Uncharacterized protein n=1 Tax=Dryococelus australis TaxID=614101 RepID=A0ABQ9G9F8_9NEOP|nr:hypothetical protein PR048_030620 [Dryococelus australis]
MRRDTWNVAGRSTRVVFTWRQKRLIRCGSSTSGLGKIFQYNPGRLQQCCQTYQNSGICTRSGPRFRALRDLHSIPATWAVAGAVFGSRINAPRPSPHPTSSTLVRGDLATQRLFGRPTARLAAEGGGAPGYVVDDDLAGVHGPHRAPPGPNQVSGRGNRYGAIVATECERLRGMMAHDGKGGGGRPARSMGQAQTKEPTRPVSWVRGPSTRYSLSTPPRCWRYATLPAPGGIQRTRVIEVSMEQCRGKREGTAYRLSYNLTYINTHSLSGIRPQSLPHPNSEAHKPTAPREILKWKMIVKYGLKTVQGPIQTLLKSPATTYRPSRPIQKVSHTPSGDEGGEGDEQNIFTKITPDIKCYQGRERQRSRLPYWAHSAQRRNVTGDPRENRPSNGIDSHDSHMLKSGGDPAGNRTRFAMVGGEQSNHYSTPALQISHRRASVPMKVPSKQSRVTCLRYGHSTQQRGLFRTSEPPWPTPRLEGGGERARERDGKLNFWSTETGVSCSGEDTRNRKSRALSRLQVHFRPALSAIVPAVPSHFRRRHARLVAGYLSSAPNLQCCQLGGFPAGFGGFKSRFKAAHDLHVYTLRILRLMGSHGGCAISTLSRVIGFSQVGVMPDDAVGRRVVSGISRFPRPLIPCRAWKSCITAKWDDRPPVEKSPRHASQLRKPSLATFTVQLTLQHYTAGTQGREKREIPWKTRRPAPPSCTIPTCENRGATRPEIEPGSPRWQASRLTSRTPRPLRGRGSGDAVASALASHQGDPGSISGGFAPGFSLAGIVLDDAAFRRVFSGYCGAISPPFHSSAAPS